MLAPPSPQPVRGSARTGLPVVLALLALLSAFLYLRPAPPAPAHQGPASQQPVTVEPAPPADDYPASAIDTIETPPTASDLAPAPQPEATPPNETERVAIEAEPAPTPLALHVTWDDGQPLTPAEVFLTAAEDLLETGVLDSEGNFTSQEAELVATHVWIVSGQRALLEQALPKDTSELPLVVPRGERLAGTVVIAGSAPGRRLQMRLSDFSGTWGRLPQWLSTALWKTIRGSYVRGAPVETNELGQFEVLGLADSWRGGLEAPTGLWWTDGGTRHELGAPEVGLVLELEARPMLRGRVVTPIGEPAADALVSFALMSDGKNERFRRTDSTTANTDGTFAIPLGPETPRHAHVAISAPGKGFAELDVELEGLQDHDAGLIRLPVIRVAQLLITDPDGQPIEGARASFTGGHAELTGPDGLAELDGLPLGATEIWADALGYKRGLATLGSQLQAPFEVRLAPTTSFELAVVDSKGAPVKGMHVFFQGGAFLREVEGDEEATQYKLGDFRPFSSEYGRNADGSETMACEFSTDKDGRISTTRIEPGVPFDVKIRDVAGKSAAWHETLTLIPGEHRHADVRLEGQVEWLTSRITDMDQVACPVPVPT